MPESTAVCRSCIRDFSALRELWCLSESRIQAVPAGHVVLIREHESRTKHSIRTFDIQLLAITNGELFPWGFRVTQPPAFLHREAETLLPFGNGSSFYGASTVLPPLDRHGDGTASSSTPPNHEYEFPPRNSFATRYCHTMERGEAVGKFLRAVLVRRKEGPLFHIAFHFDSRCRESGCLGSHTKRQWRQPKTGVNFPTSLLEAINFCLSNDLH